MCLGVDRKCLDRGLVSRGPREQLRPCGHLGHGPSLPVAVSRWLPHEETTNSSTPGLNSRGTSPRLTTVSGRVPRCERTQFTQRTCINRILGHRPKRFMSATSGTTPRAPPRLRGVVPCPHSEESPPPAGGPSPAWFSFQATAQGNHHAMSHALTYEQAAAILGCHASNVAKLVTKGQLRSRDRVRDGSLGRSEVEALAERLTQEREALAARPRLPVSCRAVTSIISMSLGISISRRESEARSAPPMLGSSIAFASPTRRATHRSRASIGGLGHGQGPLRLGFLQARLLGESYVPPFQAPP